VSWASRRFGVKGVGAAVSYRLDLHRSRQDKGNRAGWRKMPSFIRFIIVLAVIAGAIYGGMLALVMFVEPNPREMSVRVPNERLEP
jgi:hypothetical protein